MAIFRCCDDCAIGKKMIYASSKDNKKIVVERLGDKLPQNCSQNKNEEIFNEMKRAFGAEPRYILFDFCFNRANQSVAQKLAFITW